MNDKLIDKMALECGTTNVKQVWFTRPELRKAIKTAYAEGVKSTQPKPLVGRLSTVELDNGTKVHTTQGEPP